MGHRDPITQAEPDRKLKVSAALLPPPHGSSTGQHNPGELYNHRLERPAKWGVWFRSVTTAFAEYRFKRLRHHRGVSSSSSPQQWTRPPALTQQERARC